MNSATRRDFNKVESISYRPLSLTIATDMFWIKFNETHLTTTGHSKLSGSQ